MGKRISVVAQQSRQSSWKRWFLLERWRWKSIFIMEVNIERKLPRLHEKELQALFFWTYPYDKRWTCAWYLSSPLADATFWCAILSKAGGLSGWLCLQFIYTLELGKNAHLLICISVFITKVILISREADDTWVRKDGTHFFAGHSDTRTESIVYPDRKGESSSRRTLISVPNSNIPSKKDWNCARLRRADISRLNIRRYLTFIIKLIPIQILKSVIKQT